jgi:hypothetical protein
VGPAACDRACERRLYAQRQLREMLGRERDRLDKVWLVTDDGRGAAPCCAAVQAGPAGVTVLRCRRDRLARWLAPEPGHALEEHLYLVDPMGEWMMRVPVEPDPAKVKRDIDRLLRASASWDRAGALSAAWTQPVVDFSPRCACCCWPPGRLAAAGVGVAAPARRHGPARLAR